MTGFWRKNFLSTLLGEVTVSCTYTLSRHGYRSRVRPEVGTDIGNKWNYLCATRSRKITTTWSTKHSWKVEITLTSSTQVFSHHTKTNKDGWSSLRNSISFSFILKCEWNFWKNFSGYSRFSKGFFRFKILPFILLIL